MGPCFSPSLANLYMSWWEEHHMYVSTNPYQDDLACYGRYIDDVLHIWHSDKNKLPGFLEYINNNNNNIVITMEQDAECINYLDITVFHSDNRVQTKLHHKPTTGNGMLLKTSHLESMLGRTDPALKI